tara:strand:+ start:259 stop:477 length:219 start_codon:yes stop_codon:yes gene_type:complete
MIFKQYKDGSCDIKFSWKERFILFARGKLHLSNVGLRHFGNILVNIVVDWNEKFDKNTKEIITFSKDKIDGE